MIAASATATDLLCAATPTVMTLDPSGVLLSELWAFWRYRGGDGDDDDDYSADDYSDDDVNVGFDASAEAYLTALETDVKKYRTWDGSWGPDSWYFDFDCDAVLLTRAVAALRRFAADRRAKRTT